jgi:hypothetical protein
MANRSQKRRSKQRREMKRAKRSQNRKPRHRDRFPAAGHGQSASGTVETGIHPSLRYLHPYETAETLSGTPMAATDLVGLVSRYSWRQTFQGLAILSGVVANSPDGPLGERVRTLTIDPLRELAARLSASDPRWANILTSVSSRRSSMTLAHEEVILFLQHLVLLEGADPGEAPGEGEIALMLAGANGHLGDWTEDSRTSQRDRLAAELSRILRFNNAPDMLRSFVRAFSIFSSKPVHGPLADETVWQGLQQQAFGGPFNDFFETVLGPLYILTSQWGREGSKYYNPVLDMRDFLNQVKVVPAVFKEFFARLTTTRQQVQGELLRRPDGLPRGPVSLIYRPFLEIDPSTFIATSPWTVLAQLRSGLWAHYLAAAKKIFPHRGAEDVWLPAFGYMVEGWCRRVAEQASKDLRGARVVLPTHPGAADEIEDVVIVEGDGAILFSVKASMMPMQAARGTGSAADTMGWFERFLFAEAKGRHAPGAARLLNDRISRIREGVYEDRGLGRNIRLFPVVITYDSLGESDTLYKWIEERRKQLGLLCHAAVAPLCLGDVEDFDGVDPIW